MKRPLVLPIVALFVLAACASETGKVTEGSDDAATIEMRDSLFIPNEVTVEAGSTIRFRFVNKGKLTHDAFIGDEEAQKEHEDEMRMAEKMDEENGHGGGHEQDTEGGITVEPGDTGRLTHRFEEAGMTLIGCHEPGHYAAGMKVTVRVR